MIQRSFYRGQILKISFLILFVILFELPLTAQDQVRPVLNEISKDSTFDVVTWNIEWFGSDFSGPEDLDLQMNNVIKVIKTLDADLYALQEIAHKPRFISLRDSLSEYSGFYASYSSSQLETAYLFKKSIIDSLDSGLLRAQQNEADWANGRFPLFFEFDVTIAEERLRVFSYNLHSKAQADRYSYNQRRNSASSLKKYLDRSRFNASILVLGDFNDGLTKSTFEDEPSPYSIFVEDESYLPITKPLEENGEASYLPEEFRSFIDHIVTTNVLKQIHIPGAQQVADISYIENFESTTSDHAPVLTRFDFTKDFDDTYEELPEEFVIGPNYPNPFNPTTTIPFELDEATDVSVTIFDIMGRTVSVLADQKVFEAGEHSLTFNAKGLTSGIYVYRIELGTGESRTQKMALIK